MAKTPLANPKNGTGIHTGAAMSQLAYLGLLNHTGTSRGCNIAVLSAGITKTLGGKTSVPVGAHVTRRRSECMGEAGKEMHGGRRGCIGTRIQACINGYRTFLGSNNDVQVTSRLVHG